MRIGNNAETNPSQGAQNYTHIFHVSDVHFGVEDNDALAWFAQAVRDEKPEAVICTGDLTQRATRAQFTAAANWFQSLGVPVMVQPGNHDLPYYNLIERFTRPYARFGVLEHAVGSVLDLEHVVVIPFDTCARAQLRWPWSDGNVKPRKLNAALSYLEHHHSDPRRKIIACHHPLLPAEDGLKNPTIRGEMAFEAFARAGIDTVLSGHIHKPMDMVRARGNKALRLIGAGTLSTRLRGARPSYNVLKIPLDGPIIVERRNFA